MKLGKRLTEHLCGLRVHAPAIADSVTATTSPKVRISADPSCSGVKVRTRIVAKKAFATRDTFTRAWATTKDRGNRCSIHGTG
ncbi:MAG: hypothetical protein U0R64_05845 [Candidatus Nanopelagicales bacterium]